MTGPATHAFVDPDALLHEEFERSRARLDWEYLHASSRAERLRIMAERLSLRWRFELMRCQIANW